MLNNRNRYVRNGFSLVELLVGMAILGILASFAMPNFRVWLENSQIRNAAESISSGLQRARAEAVGRNINVEFVLTSNPGTSWTVKVAGAGGEIIESRSGNEGSKNVTATTDSGTTTVTYNNFGSVQASNLADGSAPFTQVDVDSSKLSVAESQNLRITIGLGGNVRMCDPNATYGSLKAC